MNKHAETTLTIASFETGDVDAERFDHAAHVYVGWLYIQQYELPEAITRFDAALKRLVTKVGAESKYHATLTWFFLLLIAERFLPDESWDAFKQRNDDLLGGSKALLSRYYSEEYLFSNRARAHFVLPNQLAQP